MTQVQEEVASNSAPHAPHRPYSVADVIAETLRRHGIDRLFLMTGGDLLLWRALRDVGIEMCLARSEAASVVMADAYARVTGRTAVVYGQWGPGAANVAGALADAHWAGSPVLALTTTVPTTSEYRNEYQELNQPPMFASVTKWQARISRADRASDVIAQGIRTASFGSPGPVHIDIPSDLVRQAAEPLDRGVPTIEIIMPAPSKAAVQEIITALQSSERPVLLAGNGVLLSNGAGALTTFAETAGLPVVTTMGGKGAIAETHLLAVGVAGRYSRKVANEVLGDADLVLAIGTDLGGLATDTYTLPKPDVAIFQIDLIAERLGQAMPISRGIVADAREACLVLTQAVEESGTTSDHATWREHVRERCLDWQSRFREVAHHAADGHVRPEAVAWILREEIGGDDIVVADTGFMGAWGGTLFQVAVAGRTFLRAAGTLGWAFPAVLGAQLAAPGRRAFALVGDGGFGYNIGDIETAVRLNIPSITIVLNNASLAYEHVGYMQAHGGDVVAEVCDFLDIDHAAVAERFGAFGARVNTADAFRAALRAAIATDRPAVIDVVVSKSRFAPVTSFDKQVERDL